ncbi:molybdopterin-dependent oxidoreductase [Frankia sp. R82]|uniref:molybdopterin-dependent oxidoreductase n=1 Tax=Frankia sp. R82 TaxID=2950553 RepID=UPI0020443F86|nr:molybdopterin-dependent oxidoreductase [Frankia sp. R82]MCM3883269.1 molybdopterin-dependent oxidoreductase [Frankia sp. R82]
MAGVTDRAAADDDQYREPGGGADLGHGGLGSSGGLGRGNGGGSSGGLGSSKGGGSSSVGAGRGEDAGLRVSEPKQWAAGVPGVGHALAQSLSRMGTRRSVRTLRLVNQDHGFDCPGCAWPEPPPGERSAAEFCENGAKAVAEEATRARVTREFFAEHSLADLAGRTGHWLGSRGRLVEPMYRPPDADHYRPIGWDDAFALIAEELAALDSPDEVAFYTSGRTSNEAAFVYQLFARVLGTNNLPDCSNMCHESSGTALTSTIGIGKGSVTLADLEAADLVLVVGQNPGTNHPRMLSSLEKVKRRGGQIVAVNPLPEAALLRFRNPQNARGIVGRGTALADQFLQIRLGGDLALFQALGRRLLAAEDAAPGTVLDHDFIARHTTGFDAYARHVRGGTPSGGALSGDVPSGSAPSDVGPSGVGLSGVGPSDDLPSGALSADEIAVATGLTSAEIDELAGRLLAAKRVVVCWAMGLTQHAGAVATIQELVNVLLLQGNIGRPGAGVCPVRGHSNVQGDRTMGIWERPTAGFLDALGAEFGFAPPRRHGLDVVDTIRAMRDGRVRVFVGMGGNFVAATPDSAVTEAAMRSCRLTVQVSTTLNRSHAVTGRAALILPTLGRTEVDVQVGGPQQVTVEDSMGMVHASRGRLTPAGPELRSEVAIVCGMAEATLAAAVDWAGLAGDYARIREHISRVVPGFEDFETRLAEPGGFALPHPPRDSRTFPTPTGRAAFTVNTAEPLTVPPGHLLLQTIRSHDQYNTTIYGLDDRYRGVRGGRRVVLVHPDDLAALGVADGTHVDLVSVWTDGSTRRAENFRAVSYPTAHGCAAAYFPETNVLVPLDATAERSNTPTSKSLVVRLEPTGREPGGARQ